MTFYKFSAHSTSSRLHGDLHKQHADWFDIFIFIRARETKRPTAGPVPLSLRHSPAGQSFFQRVCVKSRAFISVYVWTEHGGTQAAEQCSFTSQQQPNTIIPQHWCSKDEIHEVDSLNDLGSCLCKGFWTIYFEVDGFESIKAYINKSKTISLSA